ncbi:hypothetical protein AQF52_2724 [Streptomyces venezuelae]|uniref:hypothetical protein n=1 Tax=Streptomyces gardneri TaxID=66892 RepID=UPI0006BDE512|nr:hypothetical protein [Streptomyces gardneri]ALO08319.1 hypothetical protein AQF52_2724 [Streptomyces venezuelae]QPK45543.1 hypothetical protein H4W23_13505 [Streptomyces gardneri]WRK36886.1 hypothetical protein U0M97_13570 [Streptomyces venezuelae]CUM41329.1 hypothetical protein BN2537_11623 [Streptomyces venezuelae]
MVNVVFIHGTGVRQKSYDQSWRKVERGLARVRPDAQLLPCFWGEAHGARLALDGASYPVRDQDRGLTGGTDDDGLGPWPALDVEPLAEIRALAATSGEDESGYVPGRRDPWDGLADRVRALSEADLPRDPSELPTGGGDTTLWLTEELGAYVADAARTVADEISHELSGGDAPVNGESLAARAVVALAIHLADAAEDADEPLAVDGADRDLLVEVLTDRLGGKDRGAIGGGALWAANGLFGATPRRRDRTTDKIVPAGGDILRYQARGEGLRGRIAEVVELTRERDPGRPVVLLAHSLGGIACVDLLATRAVPGVDLLVTVGSQASFLYEIDALAGLRRGADLPGHFPRWVNLYDQRDLLGFVGERVFPGRVKDIRVNLRQPFPRSHTGYFAHAPLYDKLASELP